MCIKGPHLLLTPLLLNRSVGGGGQGRDREERSPERPTCQPLCCHQSESLILCFPRFWHLRATMPTFLCHLNLFHSIRSSRKFHCLCFSKRQSLTRILISYNSTFLLLKVFIPKEFTLKPVINIFSQYLLYISLLAKHYTSSLVKHTVLLRDEK